MLDSTSLTLQLENLKIIFEEAILHGSSFEEVKKIYLQIKDVDRRIAVQKVKQNGSPVAGT